MTEESKDPANEARVPSTTRDPDQAPDRGPTNNDDDTTYETGGLRLAILVGLIAFIGFIHGWSWVLIILGLVLMIFLHELGHYMTARWTGMKATEFFIGFGPKIWSFKRGETEYGLKVIPAGAYVRIIGMNNLDEVDPEDESRTYRQQSFPKRLLVVSAGSLMHFAQALVIAVVLLVVVGAPGGVLVSNVDEEQWVVGAVVPRSAAAAAELEPGDRIVAWDGEPITVFADITESVQAADVGDEVSLTVQRGEQMFQATTELVDRADVMRDEEDVEEGTPFLGVQPTVPEQTVGLADGVSRATKETGTAVWLTGEAIGQFFSPTGLSNFFETAFSDRGPATSDDTEPGAGGRDEVRDDEGRLISIIGAVRIGNTLTENSIGGLLLFFFMINIFIGLLNMAPLLPLDGGHAAVAIYERLRSRKGSRYYVDAAKLMPVAYAVVMVLIFIGLTAMYLDIVDPVQL